MATEDTEKSDAVEPASEEVTTEIETTEEKTSSSKEEIDYQAEITAEETRGKPDPLKAREAFKQRQLRDDPVIEDDDNRPLTAKEARELIASIAQETQKVTLQTEAARIAESLATSPLEAQAILAKWKNRTFPEGMTLQDQLEEMHAVVNRKRLTAVTGELKRALRGKETASTDTASTHVDTPKPGAPKQSSLDQQAYARAGFKFENGLWVKELPNKKKLFKNPKTKQQWIA
jgi:hypothetical protein